MQTGKGQKTDLLILGSGIAGLRAAIDLASVGEVLVLSKGDPSESNTEYAQGGIAAAMGDDDEVCLHLHDTLEAGDGLCREAAVRAMVEEGPRQIERLVDWGIRFDRNGGKLDFTREGAHSRSRVLHAQGDSTGSEILRALTTKVKSLKAVQLRPYALALELICDGDRVAGVTYWDEKTISIRDVVATRVLLATGGLGQVYSETTNPAMATGDGVAMAYRAGALLSDMEFIQFHPTALSVKGAPRFLLSEAIRGEGAVLRNILLERFMPHYHEAAELAPRDVVSRAMVMEMQKSRSEFVYLDLTGLEAERVQKRFPMIYATCLKYNIDITADLVPVRPAAHYAMGGVATDLHGATTIEGLYAAGEVAATGVHGANRLASNSLLEGLVYGARAAAAMAERRLAARPPEPIADASKPVRATPNNSDHNAPATSTDKTVESVRAILWEKVAVIRTGKELAQAANRLEGLALAARDEHRRKSYEARNILEVARLIARSALAREESRGAHYRSDFPYKNNSAPPRHSFVSKSRPVYFQSSGLSGEATPASTGASRTQSNSSRKAAAER